VLFDQAVEPHPNDMPIVYASAVGSNVVDVDGNRFVDLVAGFGAMLLGHLSQRVARALETQAKRTWMGLGDVFPADSKVAMLERVVSLHPEPGAKAMLCQSGSDAVTVAIKTAALHTGRPGILAFEGAYHGLGYAPLAACGYRESFRLPFAKQLNPHVRFAPYPADDGSLDAALGAARRALSHGDIGAVLVEPVLGRGGCVVPPEAFLPALALLAREAGALLIADEIWTGLGRSGSLLASSRFNVVPDVICLGKGLGGGLPISACVARGPIMEAWRNTPGVVHTTTFQGSSLACATGIATIDAVRAKKLDERAERVGSACIASMRAAFQDVARVRRVSGLGLMIGIVLDSAQTAAQARRALFARGYITLTGGRAGNVLTLTPPLNIDEDLLEGFVDTAAQIIRGLPSP
jgi:4-aminobutyrate aminotransferase/(S)-3-amino-2-methylpropionate transaminase